MTFSETRMLDISPKPGNSSISNEIMLGLLKLANFEHCVEITKQLGLGIKMGGCLEYPFIEGAQSKSHRCRW